MTNEAINTSNLLAELIDRRVYTQIQFFNAYHEFHTTQSLIKALSEGSDTQFIELVTGEQIELSGIVSLNGQFMPGFEHFEDFTCDC